jgi:hypothetical protein
VNYAAFIELICPCGHCQLELQKVSETDTPATVQSLKQEPRKKSGEADAADSR